MEDTDLLDQLLAVADSISDSEEKAEPTKSKQKTIKESDLFLADIDEFSKNATASTSEDKLERSLSEIFGQDSEHKGDTDSSDDESNRNHQNSKYNEYGREIKHLLTPQASTTSFVRDNSTWKRKSTTVDNKKQTTLPVNVFTDPFFGIRIVNPLISSAVLQERMSNRSAVSMSQVKQFIKREIQQDWVISGVIVSKSNVKTSQKGNQYLIWTLSDLKNDLQTVAVFLFGNAYKQLWKTTVGTVLGILNPTIMDQREGSKDQASLSVDNAQKVMVFGQSKDYSLCKSKKKDGNQCSSFVNKNNSEYCIYHIKQEYQKLSKRSELQANFVGGGLTALRNKVLGKNEVFYAGKSYTAIPAKKSQKLAQKDKDTLKSLSQLNREGIKTTNGILQPKINPAATLEASRSQRLKDLQLLKKLNGEKVENVQEKIDKAIDIDGALLRADNMLKNINRLEKKLENNKKRDIDIIKPSTSKINTETDKKSVAPSLNCNKTPVTSLKDSTNLQKSPIQTKNVENTPKNTKFLENSNLKPDEVSKLVENSKFFKKLSTPKLSNFGDSKIDLSTPLIKTPVLNMDKAKLKALKYVEKNGPITTEPKKNGVKRFLETTEDFCEKRQKLADDSFTSERFKKIMALQSKHTNLLDAEDLEKEEKYFKKLELREKMEDKMATIFKVECKAVRCLTCKYESFSASDKCKEERHVIKVIDAVKRFFKCAKCGNRTVTLKIIPLISCSNCGSSKWDRTTMMKEKVVQIGEKLSIRGLEEKYVGTVNTGGNVNLLVPDE